MKISLRFSRLLAGSVLGLAVLAVAAQAPKPESKVGKKPSGFQPNSPWPVALGTIGNTGMGVGSGSKGLLAWTFQASDTINSALAIAADGTIYFGAEDGSFYAVSPNGALKWQILLPYGGALNGGGAAIGADGTIYVGTQTASSETGLTALDPKGNVKWFQETAPASSPTIGSDGTIYVNTETGPCAFSPSGGLLWSNGLASMSIGSAPPAIGPSLLLWVTRANYGVGDFTLSGTGLGGIVTSYIELWPSVDSNGWVYIGDTGNVMQQAKQGDDGWEYVAGGSITTSAAISTDGSVYFGATDKQLYALTSAGKLKWMANIGNFLPSSPVIASDGTVYIGDDQGYLNAFSPSGQNLWTFHAGGSIGTPAIGADGTIYFCAGDRNLYAVGYGQIPVSSITVSPASVIGGTGAVGTVTLTQTAPSYGDAVVLSSSASSASVPSSLTIPFGQTSGTFAISTNPVSASTNVTISAASAGVSESTTLQLLPPTITGLTVSPTTVTGGVTSTGTVTLGSTAPSSGVVISLVSNSPFALVPPSVAITSGTSGSFPITTSATNAAQSATVTATFGGVSLTASLTLNPPMLASITLNPVSIGGGASALGSVILASPAPASGLSVSLVSQYPAFVSVPQSVIVPAGQTSASFAVTTKLAPATFSATITASTPSSTVSGTLSIVESPVVSVSLAPTIVGAGNPSVGTVTLSSAAPAGGWTVVLSSNSSVVQVPGSVVVSGGATTATFPITTVATSANVNCTITASDQLASVSAQLSVVGISVGSITLNPTTVIGVGQSTGTVAISAPAPAGGWVVTLTSETPSLASVPASVTIPAGATTAEFTINVAQQVREQYRVNITASNGSSSVTVILVIRP